MLLCSVSTVVVRPLIDPLVNGFSDTSSFFPNRTISGSLHFHGWKRCANIEKEENNACSAYLRRLPFTGGRHVVKMRGEVNLLALCHPRTFVKECLTIVACIFSPSFREHVIVLIITVWHKCDGLFINVFFERLYVYTTSS